MIKPLLTLVFLLISNSFFAQKNFIDQPYLETSAKTDTLITPDKIYLSIALNEADSKNKKSVEELERKIEIILKKLNINTKEDLKLADISSNYKSYFLKGQNILKSKNYQLLVRDAITAGRVLIELENEGISNVRIIKTEYSKKENLILELKAKAIKKSKTYAEHIAKGIGQKVGKAILITDGSTFEDNYYDNVYKIRGMASSSLAPEPINIDFKKLKFSTEIKARYILE